MLSVPLSPARWALLPLLAATSFAATFLADGYSIRVWRTEDGLPQNTVTSAVQTRDGYLWFGTHSGLARFDGERFQTFDSANTPELRDRRISSLYEDSRGSLWIGQETGTLLKYDQSRFEAVPLAGEGSGGRIVGIGEDESRRLWIMRQSGVLDSLEGTRLPSIFSDGPPGLVAWSRSSAGQIWLYENGIAARLEDNRTSIIKFDAARRYQHVGGIAAASDGGLWVLRDDRVRKWRNGVWTEDRGDYPVLNEVFSACLELHDGTLAVGTLRLGLYLIFGDGRPTIHLDHGKGLPQDWVRFLYEDSENNLWVGAGSAGLAAIHSTAFSVLNAPDGWQGCSVLSVAPGRDGSLWIGTDGAGLYHSFPGRWQNYGESEGLGNPYIWAVTETPGGDVWAGNYWFGGPYRLQNERFVRPPAVDPQSSPVLALQQDAHSDGLLIGRRDGLLRLDRAGVNWLVKASDIGAADVSSLAQDREGATWCGFTTGGVVRVADGKITVLHRKEGLGSDAIQCLFCDSDGALWIGTADNGLTRLKNGRFVSLGLTQGLVDNAICHILDDGLGYFWLSSHHGIQRVAKQELNRCADGQIPAFSSQKYDQNDGLPILEFTGEVHAAGCRTEDGRLWFASSKGVVSVDPRRIQTNPTPPPVVIEALLIDGRSVALDRKAGFRPIQPDHQRLEFQYSGLSYVAPNKVAFKYRLEGIDRTWVEAGGKRTAEYSHLPAGDYRFRVIACNNDGIWNRQGAALDFSVAPYFWQTWWFISSCTFLVLVGVAWTVRFITRRRLQKRMEQLERQSAIEHERARIAQDIHDDVGTSLIRIAMFSQPEQNVLDHPQQAAAILSRIYSTAREMTRALDEIVWAIDPRHDTLDSLIRYMGRFAQESLGAAGVRCRLDVPLEVPAWPLTAEIRHNLFLAFKEALNNVVKHAAATEVRISLEVRSTDFIFRLRDNGRGFDRERPAANAPGRIASGNGLRNIEGRISRIGGRCDISSAFGKGTVVAFEIPVQKLSGGRLRNSGPAVPPAAT